MALMKALSKELAPDGVRVNAVLIGLIESGQWVRGAAASGVELEEFYERFAKDAGIPLGRLGAPRSSPTWDASSCRPVPRTSPGQRSTSMGGCRRPSEGYAL